MVWWDQLRFTKSGTQMARGKRYFNLVELCGAGFKPARSEWSGNPRSPLSLNWILSVSTIYIDYLRWSRQCFCFFQCSGRFDWGWKWRHPVSNYCLYYDGNQLTISRSIQLSTREQLDSRSLVQFSSDYDWMHTAIIDKPHPPMQSILSIYYQAANHSDYMRILPSTWLWPDWNLWCDSNNTWTTPPLPIMVSTKTCMSWSAYCHVNDPAINNYSTGIRLGSLKNYFTDFSKQNRRCRIWNIARLRSRFRFHESALNRSELAWWRMEFDEGRPAIHDWQLTAAMVFWDLLKISINMTLCGSNLTHRSIFQVISDDNSENRLPTTVALYRIIQSL